MIHFDVLKDYFQSDIHRMINSMVDLMLDEDQQELLNTSVSLYNPSCGNDKGFILGRMEQKDIEEQNMQVIAIGGYFSIRSGRIAEGFKYDSKLRGRCSKISGIHELAAIGRAVLTVGLTGNKQEAILPAPPRRLNRSRIRKEENRTSLDYIKTVNILCKYESVTISTCPDLKF